MISDNDGFSMTVRRQSRSGYPWHIGGSTNTETSLNKWDGVQTLPMLVRPFVGWANHAKGLQPKVWYAAEIRVQGDQLSCRLNGMKAFPTPYIEIPDFPKGAVSIGTWNASYRFRNIRVTSLDGKKVLLEGLPDIQR